MSFICTRMKNHFDIKARALNLVLIQRPGETRKWRIVCLGPVHPGLTSQGDGFVPRELLTAKGLLWSLQSVYNSLLLVLPVRPPSPALLMPKKVGFTSRSKRLIKSLHSRKDKGFFNFVVLRYSNNYLIWAPKRFWQFMINQPLTTNYNSQKFLQQFLMTYINIFLRTSRESANIIDIIEQPNT